MKKSTLFGAFLIICGISVLSNQPWALDTSTPNKSYQIARTVFLPDITEGDIGFDTDTIDGDYNASSCADYPLTSCPEGGFCSSCPVNKHLYRLVGCNTEAAYKRSNDSCIKMTCPELNSSYRASVPSGQICTKFTEKTLTCYKNCRDVNCGDYNMSCTTRPGNVAGYEKCPDCESSASNCDSNVCKIAACEDGYKLSADGSSCIAKDDTCPSGYYKTCETGTQGTPKYTEKGTPCYQCKPQSSACWQPITSYSDLWQGFCCDESKDYLADIEFADSDVNNARIRPQTINAQGNSVCPEGWRLPTFCEFASTRYKKGLSAFNSELQAQGKSPIKTSDQYSSSQGLGYFIGGKGPTGLYLCTATDSAHNWFATPSGKTSAYVDVYGGYVRCVREKKCWQPITSYTDLWDKFCCSSSQDYLANIEIADSDVNNARIRPQTVNAQGNNLCPSGWRLPTFCELMSMRYKVGFTALNQQLQAQGKSPIKTSDQYSSSQGLGYFVSGKGTTGLYICAATDTSHNWIATPSGQTSSYVDVYGGYVRCVRDK